MPRLIDPGGESAIELDELADLLATTRIDVRDEDAFATLGPALARLGRNQHFLADLAIDELKDRCAGQATRNGYGPQVFMLHPPDGNFVVRANFWPAREDWAVRSSGPAAFFYDLPHDHNFPFLTVGYLGPGYWSDDYVYDVAAVTGLPDEPAGLRFVERSRLDPGKLMLYRMRRDVHVQIPPDRFSVSLNILGFDAAQPWLDQYRFDPGRDRIAEALTITPSEALITIAGEFGGGNGRDLVEGFTLNHPSERMRVTGLMALASGEPTREGRIALFEAASDDPNRYVAGHARRRLALIDSA